MNFLRNLKLVHSHVHSTDRLAVSGIKKEKQKQVEKKVEKKVGKKVRKKVEKKVGKKVGKNRNRTQNFHGTKQAPYEPEPIIRSYKLFRDYSNTFNLSNVAELSRS